MAGIPRTLEKALQSRFVVPFIGAGVSRSVNDTQGLPLFPTWRDLLLQAAARLRSDHKGSEASVVEGLVRQRHPDLLEAARRARAGLGSTWHPFLREVFDPPRRHIEESSLALARAVWRLPSRLIVTTNYDQILRFALGRESDDLIPLDVDSDVEIATLLREQVERPTVWHLHGHIHNAKRIVLTPDGYNALYPSPEDEVRHQAALHALRQLLTARTFLFIGFSLEDEHIGSQIDWVQRAFAGATGPHYLLARERDRAEAERRLRNLSSIELLPFDDHGKPLVERIEELAVLGGAARHASVSSKEIPPKTTAPPTAPISTGTFDLAEVRRGYRQVYAYQRRMFDRLADLSDALGGMGLSFERWDPLLFSRPARSTTEFFRRSYWAWDFLPAYRLSLVWRASDSKERPALRVQVNLVADGGFRPGAGYEPNPTSFEPVEAARSELQVGLLRVEDATVPFDKAFQLLQRQHSDLRDGSEHRAAAGSGECAYRYFCVDLADILEVPGLMARVVTPIRAWLGRD